MVLCTSAVLCGCKEICLPELPVYGEAVQNLELRLVDGGPYTKSSALLADGVVEDVNVYMFDSAGNTICSRYFPQENVHLDNLTIYSDETYSIYVLANWGDELNFLSEQQLQEFSYTAGDVKGILLEKGADIMCGKVTDVKLPVKGNVLDVGLRRLYSQIRIKLNTSNVNSAVEFSVKKVGIKNVPRSVLLFSDNVASDVGDGEVLEESIISTQGNQGLLFTLFENMQGRVGSASGNKGKANLLTQEQQQVCSYIEMECAYRSTDRTGTMIYRFYLGTDHSNCNVPRNSTQTVTVRFNGKVSPDEYSVSVDNSALLYRPTSIWVNISELYLNSKVQSSYQSVITVYPDYAYDKSVVWSTSDPSVATVDQNGLITSQGKGSCTITVTSVDRPEVYAQVSVRVSNYTGGS